MISGLPTSRTSATARRLQNPLELRVIDNDDVLETMFDREPGAGVAIEPE